MDNIRKQYNIFLKYKDIEYSADLAKALCRLTDLLGINYVNESAGEAYDLTVDEDIIPMFLPVRQILSRIMALLNIPSAPGKAQENVVYTCFTSAVGGGGLTSAALCYARIKSRLFSENIAFISFDPPLRNKLHGRDEYGVAYLENWPCSPDCDEIVFDVSMGCGSSSRILDMCDRIVVISGFDENRSNINKEYFNLLDSRTKNYLTCPDVLYFENELDTSFSSFDIHGQLGKEVKELAQKLGK